MNIERQPDSTSLAASRSRFLTVAALTERALFTPDWRHGQLGHSPDNISPRRRGYGIVEIIICMILLGSLATWLIPLLNTITTKRAELSERSRLQQVSMNVVERLSLLTYNAESFETQTADLSTAVKQSHATLTLKPGDINPQGLRRIDLTITPDDPEKIIRPIKLTTWMKEAAQ